MFAVPFAVPLALTISRIRWLAMCACLLAITPARALAQQACVFTESQFQGTPHCFRMDALTDVPDGIAIKSVRVDPGAELIVATGTQLSGALSRLSQSVSHPAFSEPDGTRYRSFQVRPGACVYQDAHYHGRQTCFAPGPLQPELTTTLDAAISSVTMARGLALYTFSEQNGKGDSSFHYGNQPFLRTFNDKARSLQLVRWIANCFEDCPIPYSEAYDLDKVVYTTSLQANKGKWARLSQAVATFETDSRQSFTVNAGNAVEFRFVGRTVTTTYRDDTVNADQFELDDGTAYVSIALGFRAGTTDLDYQLIASDRSRRFMNASPIATVAQDAGRLTQTFAIENDSNHPVRLKALSFANVAPQAWVQPASQCWSNPMLAVTGHFLGPCSAPSPGPTTHDAKTIVFSAGARPNQRHMTVNPVTAPRIPAPPTLLASYVRGYNPLARYAASRVCHTKASAAGTHRVRRSPDHMSASSACIERTMTIIALYQALFGPQWDADNFQRTIDHILAHGTTGYASSQPELESELIGAVRRQTGSASTDTRRETAVAAFRAADHLYQTSRNGTLDLEQADTLRSPPSATAPATLAEASTALLGSYRLDLSHYQPIPILPRITRDGHLQPDTQHPFEFEFITSDDRAAHRHLQAVLQDWTDGYRAITNDDALTPAQRTLANRGTDMAESLYRAVAYGETGTYVVAHYRGQPAAVLMAIVDDEDPSLAEIDTVVSAPRNVVYGGQNGVVRGAGSAALHAALTYLQGRGVTAVVASAVTKPSAIIKQRAGFQLVAAHGYQGNDDTGND
nr:hypothetical protein [uncultured Cupriavidus sp.]